MSSLPSFSTSLQITQYDLDILRSNLAISSLPDFIRQAWPILEPSTPLSWNWHLDELCSVLVSISKGEIKRIIINIPPGSMKSSLLTLWAAWEWSDKPHLSYLTASYSDDNTIRDNRRLRSVVTSHWYKKNFWSRSNGSNNRKDRKDRKEVSLASDQSAKVRFDTTERGWRIASSVGGVGTGEHPDRIIIDDPHKAADARSPIALKSCQEWFERTISTRIMKDPAIIIVMQRLHMEDLSGHLLAKGGWHHVMFPMRFDPDRADPRDHRTKPRELLWPERWPEEKVRQEELDLGPFGTAGQLDQNPVPEGGGLFRREWFDIVDEVPLDCDWVRGWDIAETDGGGDWTVGTKIGRSRSTKMLYIADVIRVQSTLVDSLILNTARMDGRKCKIREGAGSGKATIKARSILLAGFDYAPSPETDSKIERAAPFRSQSEARNVKIKRAEWNEIYLSVLSSFPVGKFDDDVDSSSNAANELLGNNKRVIKATWP